MKALLVWPAALLLLLQPIIASAQTVDFRNNQSDFTTAADRDVYFVEGTPLGSSFGFVGTNFQARLLYGPDAKNLQPATYIAPARFRNVTGGIALAGTWTGGNRTLAGFTYGDTVTLVVQAWEAGPDRPGTFVPGRTFDEARADAGLWGESAPFTYTVAGPGSATTNFYMNNFRKFAVGPCTGVVSIVSQPLSQTVPADTNVVFSIGLLNVCNAAIQWQLNETNIAGEVFQRLSITNVRPRHAGEYRVIVSNSTAILTSAVATLTVTGPYIQFLRPHNSQTFLGPADVLLEAEVVGVPGQVTNVIYQRDGTLIGSSLTPPFSVVASNLAVADYNLLATGFSDSGQNYSDRVFIRVMDPPRATVQPAQQIALAGSTPEFLTVVTGTQPIYLQWFFNDGPLVGQTSATLALPQATVALSGMYHVTATNAVGNFTSDSASLKVRQVVVLIDGNPIHTPSYTSSVPVSVSLMTSYSRGTIFYTLDGSTPDFTSRQYLEPFTLDQSVRLRAIGYSADFYESGEAEPLTISLPPLRFLSASSGGGGSISVNPNLSGYRQGETITLTAQPSNGWSFLEWRGDANGTNVQIALSMNSDRCVRALFGTTLTTTTFGNGRIVTDRPGALYPYGTELRLYAVPATNSFFVLWGNYASGSDNPLVYSVVEPTPAISSAFAALPANQVTFSAIPDGHGSFEITPRTNRYTRGQIVSVRAYSWDSRGLFVQWSGDAAGTNETLSLTLDQSKTVTGHFTTTPHLISDPCHIGYNSEGFYATLSGTWGERYAIHFANPLEDWQPLVTFTNKYGTTQFTDPTATNTTHRLYRAVLAEP